MMLVRRSVAVLLLSMLGWAPAVHGQQKSPQQQQRTPEQYAAFLEERDRVARLQVPRVVEALGLKPGMTVADVGAGSGLFTRPIAKAVAPGTVFANDIDAGLLKILATRSADAGLANVTTVLGAADDPRLPRRVDLVFICDALHHIANPGAYLKTLRAYLAANGRVAVIDYREHWPDGHEQLRFSSEQFEGWMKAAGFTREASYDWIADSFFTIYR